MLIRRVTHTTLCYEQSNKEMKDLKPHHVAGDLMDCLEILSINNWCLPISNAYSSSG